MDRPADSYTILVVDDFKLPDMTGRQVIKTLTERNNAIPFILVTGQGDEKLAVEIMKGGARDYIIKDGGFLELLPSVITQVLEQVERESQLRAAEKALMESEAQYRGVFNSSLDAVFVVDFNGKIVDANPQSCKIYDYSLEELINLPVKKLIHPDYHYQYEQFTMDLRSKGDFQAESMAVQKDGTTVDVEIRSTVFTFKGQKNILMVVRDISERKWKEEELRLTNQQLRVSEQALREREARLRAIFQGAAIGMALIDLGGHALESNQSLQKMLGYSRTELRQKVFPEFTHPEDLQACAQIFDDLTQGKCDYYQIETRYLRKDEGIVWVRLTASLVRNETGKPNYIINMMEDISEQKWAEQNLRQSQERFQLLSEAAFEGILIHEKGRILDGNSALGRMFGYEIPEIIGKDCRDFVTPEFRELVTENIHKETTEPYDLVGLKKDGSTFDIQVWAHSLEYQGRKVRVVTVRDITERRQIEEEIRIFAADLERSNRDLEQFARVISRHLQEPLQAIINQSRIFNEDRRDRSLGPHREFVQQTCTQAQRMQMKIDALLEYSKITGPGRPHLMVNLEESALKACDALHEKIDKTGAKVEIASLPAIPGNQIHLQKLFENLIDNALQFSRSVSPEVHIDCDDREHEYEITVTDNGRGMDSSELEKIFDIFYRRPDEDPYSGSGIGLAIARKIVELHGGCIRAHSQLGRGSTFHITFPAKGKKKTDISQKKFTAPTA